MNDQKKIKRKELLALPRRDWHVVSSYPSVLIVPTGSKHDSGYGLMAIVGLDRAGNPVEIAAYCDDITWVIPHTKADVSANLSPIDAARHPPMPRSDCLWPSGIIRFWGRPWYGKDCLFQVGMSLSSIEITIVKDK